MWNSHPSLVTVVNERRHRELVQSSDRRRLLRNLRRLDQRHRRT